MTLRENIRRALTLPCNYDFLAIHRVFMAERAFGTSHRAVYARIQKLVRFLVSGRVFNYTSLAREFGISTKTAQRDVDFLRAQGVQIIYSDSSFTFQLTPGQSHPLLQLKGVR